MHYCCGIHLKSWGLKQLHYSQAPFVKEPVLTTCNTLVQTQGTVYNFDNTLIQNVFCQGNFETKLFLWAKSNNFTIDQF